VARNGHTLPMSTTNEGLPGDLGTGDGVGAESEAGVESAGGTAEESTPRDDEEHIAPR
jgi:hypothetical protein